MPSCASSERRTSSTSLSTSACAIRSRNAISRRISAFMALSESGALAAEALDHVAGDGLEIVGLGDVGDDAELVEPLGGQRVAQQQDARAS